MIIVLDTNVWLKEMALNSAIGSAVRFYIKHHNASLALPEVVRLEVEKNFRKNIKEYVKNVDYNYP